MRPAVVGGITAALAVVLAVPGWAQTNQLSFRGTSMPVQPASVFARITDNRDLGLPRGDASVPRELLNPGWDEAEYGPPPSGRTTLPAARGVYTLQQGQPAADATSEPAASSTSPPIGDGTYQPLEPGGEIGEYASPCDGQCGDACGAGPIGHGGGWCCDPCAIGYHRTSVYGGYVLMRPRDAEVSYAVPIDGPISTVPPANPLQVGGFGIVDPDYDSGFLAGLNVAIDPCSSIDVRYLNLSSSTSDAISTSAPLVLRSLVAHPSSSSAATDFLSARAELDIDLDVIDAVYRHALHATGPGGINWVLGARYGKLDQEFGALFVNNGVEGVLTEIDFEGTGPRLGLEFARQHHSTRLFGFASGFANFLAGRFRGSYFQGQSFDPEVVDTDWEAGRIVPVLDLETGLGWTSCGGCLRIQSGYMFSGWFNVVKTEDFIHAVQSNRLTDLSDTMTFDGWNFRAEWRF